VPDLKIALLQISDQGTLDANLAEGLRAVAVAANRGADIALLPETWSHGCRFFTEGDKAGEAAWRASALGEQSSFITAHQRAARDLGIAIGCTFLRAGPKGPENSLVLIDRRGEIVLRYSKVHVCLHTIERHCASGSGFHVATLATAAGDVEVGAMICYDREFPESARILGLKGAEIVLVPNACIFDDHRLAQLKTRAFENKFTIAMTNYPATHPDCDGRSVGISAMAFSHERAGPATPTNQQSAPRETLLAEAGRDPAIVDFTVDLDELSDYRRNAVWGTPERQVHAYADLLDGRYAGHFAPERLIS
jgi:predicted amidohydrolase